MELKRRPTGMVAFTVVWLGQMISLLGTGMTRFALTIWAWQTTGEATALALVGFFSFGPTVLLSPVAGALVDRWNRKLVMMFSDLAAGLATIVILLLFASGNLQMWHLYLAGAFAGAFEAFQFPAYSAAVTTMLPKRQYTRANGMLGLLEPASQIASPLLAGFLLAITDLSVILVIDVITFSVAIGLLLLVHIPQPMITEAGRRSRSNLWQESLYGFRYIFERPSLLGLQLIFLAGNFVASGALILLPAFILARANNDQIVLGSVQSMFGIGGVVGGVLLSLWGGPKRRIHGVLIGWALGGLFEGVLMGLGRALSLWSISAFLSGLFIPFINGSNQAIWQAKVAPDVQGRVFAARRLVAQISFPLALLLAGPLADHVFGPAMMPGGGLTPIFGRIIAAGPGAGMGLMLVIVGLIMALIGLSGYAFPVIRNVEDLLPDHDMVPDAPPTDGAPSLETGVDMDNSEATRMINPVT